MKTSGFITQIIALTLALVALTNTVSGQVEEKVSTETGTMFNDGAVLLSDETLRLLTDLEYRDSVYPTTYTLADVPDLLKSNRLSFALWTLINTYDDQPDMVKRVVFKLTQSGVRGSTILDAFYTYAFADPETFKFVSGDVTMARPDVIEAKLYTCKTLAAYSDKFAELYLAER